MKRCDMLPFSVKIRNRVAGQLAERTGLPVGMKLDPPVVEYVMRDTDMDVDPMINHTHIYAMKAATPEEMEQIDSTCLKVNSLLMAYLKEINIELIDFKLEFGRYHGRDYAGYRAVLGQQHPRTPGQGSVPPGHGQRGRGLPGSAAPDDGSQLNGRETGKCVRMISDGTYAFFFRAEIAYLIEGKTLQRRRTCVTMPSGVLCAEG